MLRVRYQFHVREQIRILLFMWSFGHRRTDPKKGRFNSASYRVIKVSTIGASTPFNST